MATSSSFQDLINSSKPVLVDFYAEWCGPCKMMKPILDDVKHQVGEEAHIIKVDVDRNPAVASALNIRGVPTLMIYRNGKVLWRKSGVVAADELTQLLKKYMNS
jgi:thioredoxin 1